MQSEILVKKKLVCIWLTRNESVDPEVLASLEPIYQKYTALNYLVVVFRSGSRELIGLTSELLRYNRRLIAEREVKAKRRESTDFLRKNRVRY